jgi:hypothetical protein
VDTERHNHEQIERLNQRGGRTLSIVDLIEDGTLSVEMAAYGLRAMAGGASLLTGARPGGAGKTTLMATFLHFLPPGVPIVTTDRSQVIADALDAPADEPACYLAHEIGSGHWYAYIWGRDVADFFSLIEGARGDRGEAISVLRNTETGRPAFGRRVASCLHADTLPELTAILTSDELGVSKEQLAAVDLILFMHVRRTLRGLQRRVATFYEADDQGGHRLLYEWVPDDDAFRPATEIPDRHGLAPYTEFVQRLVDEGEADCRAVRRKVLDFYGSQER